MATDWRMIRVPADLAARLERLAIENDAAHAAGHLQLPNAYADRCPIHQVISMALDRLESHRARGKHSRKGASKPTDKSMKSRPEQTV